MLILHGNCSLWQQAFCSADHPPSIDCEALKGYCVQTVESVQRPLKLPSPVLIKLSHWAADIFFAFQKALEPTTYCAQQQSPKLLPAHAEIKKSIEIANNSLIIYQSLAVYRIQICVLANYPLLISGWTGTFSCGYFVRLHAFVMWICASHLLSCI